MLIENPSKWPIGFMYLKYLKFSCGFNDILQLTDYRTQSVSTKKYFHLEMNKTLVQNFNINFIILLLSFIVFIVIFLVKYKKQSEYLRNQFNRKYLPKGEYKPVDINQLLILIEKLRKMSDKAFWMVNYLSFWLVLPLIASFSASVFIQNNLVTTNIFNSMDKLFVQLGSTIGTISMLIILIICLNNFMNLWLSQQQMRKLGLKPEEISYKRALFIYLLIIGMLILFFNKTKLSLFPFSLIVLIVQVSFILLIIYINPYKQSLRIHTVTLLINQVIYILFLVLVNFINFSQNINQIFVIVFGYIVTVSCFISVILAGLRLFYQLKYGETLQRQIMKERQRNDKTDQLRKQQLYKRRMKKLKNLTLQNTSDSQKLRAKNRFLYQNQVNEDKAKDTLQWLDQRKWAPEDKQKYFIQKSIYKPLDWLQTHDKEQFEQQRGQNEIYERQRREKRERIMSDNEYRILREDLSRQGDSKVREWNRKLQIHEKRMRTDVNYVMEVKKGDRDRYTRLQYQMKR